MKTHLDISHTGTLGDERTRMTFDENSVAHLMSVLTDLYSDPALAVIREYSTNALDSHRAAGNPAPIEVELPSSLRPIFVVRDHGTGMSLDTLTNRFSKYGWSNKRDSDEAVGMLGLGCKAGLSYTSQFTLVSIHDGIQITALITREADGAGAVQIIDTAATDLPNGVEIQVPVKSCHDFNSKATNFFKFWEKGQVLVNGVEPQLYDSDPESIKLSDDVTLVRQGDYRSSKDTLVMGNVSYPFPEQSDGRIFPRANWGAVVRVPIGAVDFTPSREALHLTKRTLAAVKEAHVRVLALVEERIQTEMDAAANATVAVGVCNKWVDLASRSNTQFKYKDLIVPQYIDTRLPPVIPYRAGEFQKVLTITCTWGRYNAGFSNKSALTGKFIATHAATKALHVVGFKGNGVTLLTKRKIVKYAEDQKLGAGERIEVYLYKEEFGSPWLDHAYKVQYSDIQAIDLGDPPAEAKPKSAWRLLNPDGYLDNADELAPADKAVWMCPEDNYHRASLYSEAMMLGLRVVALQMRQVSAFQKNHSEYLSVKEWCEREVAKGLPSPAVMLDPNQYGPWATEMPATAVLDPELAQLLRDLRDVDERAKQRFKTLRDLCHRAGVELPTVDAAPVAAQIRKTMRRYPVLSYWSKFKGGGKLTHGQVIEIVNSLYTTRQRNTRW